MKRVIFAFILTIFFIISAIISQELIRISIVNFDDSSSKETCGRAATNTLTQLLSNNKNFYVRPPDAIQAYITLLEQVQSGLLEPTVLKKQAPALQVDYLLVGSIGKITDTYELDARLVDVNSWKVISSYCARGKNLASTVEDIAEEFSSLNTTTVKNHIEQTKESPTIGVQEFREHFENPPHALYCATFMEMITSALVEKTKNNIIESKFTSHLIEEKTFEMAGIIENSKADQLFAIQGIAYRIIGNIRVFPDLIVINYAITDTSSQKIIFTGSFDIVNPQSLRPAASHIAKIIDDALNNKIGNLIITTTPVDADIYINDIFAGSTKDKKLLAIVQKGKNSITAKAQGFKAVTVVVSCEPRTTKTITVKLERITERLLQEAMLFESRGEYKKAIERYDEFVRETGNTLEANVALYRMGHIFLKNLQNYEQAQKIFTQLLQNYPEPLIRTEGYFGLAQTYLAMGNKQLAKSSMEYLIEHYPDSNAALEAKELLKTINNR